MEFAEQLFEWITLVVTIICKALSWLAVLISDKTGLEFKNTYLLILAGLSLYASYQITEDRGLKLILVGGIIFTVFYKLGGVII